ncbi:hypothetical protein N7445_003461 [Penicillium cf. griseofulvum]|nr:hypothetical protein N7445_003461 [Penicillium cf. griseofulvum]
MAYNVTTELFAEWAVGLVIIAVRIYARWKHGKARFATVSSLKQDSERTDVYGSNIGFNENTAMEVPDSQVATLRTGSIHAFIAWISYVFMVWSFKGVLMFFYNRLTCVPRLLSTIQNLCH